MSLLGFTSYTMIHLLRCFKGEEYIVIVYFEINSFDEDRYVEDEDVNVFIDVDRLIIYIGKETVKYKEV